MIFENYCYFGKKNFANFKGDRMRFSRKIFEKFILCGVE